MHSRCTAIVCRPQHTACNRCDGSGFLKQSYSKRTAYEQLAKRGAVEIMGRSLPARQQQLSLPLDSGTMRQSVLTVNWQSRCRGKD